MRNCVSRRYRNFLIFLFFFFLAGCLGEKKVETKGRSDSRPKLSLEKSVQGEGQKTHLQEVQEVVLMTFNVENLFDTKDDPKKNDETFLPAKLKTRAAHIQSCKKISRKKWRDQCLYWDWNEKYLRVKMQRLAEVIRRAHPSGPDVIMFQEVENLAVLERLRKEHLQGLNYQPAILIEGKDLRGIDVAVMSKLPLKQPAQLHEIPFPRVSKKRRGDTRGILQVDLMLPDQTPLTVFSVHFPAPFHPASMRKQAFAFLNQLMKKIKPNHIVVAGGDFNIPSKEDQELSILKTLAQPHWHVSHRIGCKDCRGTNYYPPKNSWSFLDMILVSKRHSKTWLVSPESVTVFNQAPEQKTTKGHPKAFEMPKATGVSDHWPVLLKLQKN